MRWSVVAVIGTVKQVGGSLRLSVRVNKLRRRCAVCSRERGTAATGRADRWASEYRDSVQPVPDLSVFSTEAMLDDLRRLVEVESPSLDLDALAMSATVLSGIVERLLGSAPTIVDSPTGPHVHWSGGR